MKRFLSKGLILIIFAFNSCNMGIKDSNSLVQSAILKIELKQYDEAFEYLNKAINTDSTNPEAYYLRAQVFDLQGKDKDRICEDLQMASELGSERAKEAYKQYCIGISSNEYTKLLKKYNDYIERYPDKYEGYFERGNLYFRSNKIESALLDYNRVLEILEHPVAYYNRGVCYLKLNNKTKGCLDINKAIKLGYEKAKDVLCFCE